MSECPYTTSVFYARKRWILSLKEEKHKGKCTKVGMGIIDQKRMSAGRAIMNENKFRLLFCWSWTQPLMIFFVLYKLALLTYISYRIGHPAAEFLWVLPPPPHSFRLLNNKHCFLVVRFPYNNIHLCIIRPQMRLGFTISWSWLRAIGGFIPTHIRLRCYVVHKAS